jgi:hypothetical protein
VAAWAKVVLHEKSRDTHTDVEPGLETHEGTSEALQSLPEVQVVKAKLDLSFVSTSNLYEVRAALARFFIVSLVSSSVMKAAVQYDSKLLLECSQHEESIACTRG